MNADELRAKIIETYDKFKPSLEAYYDYAQRTAALSEEYHAARLSEVCKVPIEQETLLASLDARETPKSLDVFLATTTGQVKRIIFDRANSKYHIFI